MFSYISLTSLWLNQLDETCENFYDKVRSVAS